jgi:pimeloyl-ACP methyl ester carboxylesterase
MSAPYSPLVAALALALLAPVAVAAAGTVSLRTGEIDGAHYAIARTGEWNGNVLILAHGYRPEDAPLKADLRVSDPPYARLLAEGWLLATSSYRRNGIVVRDAIADINALRDHIDQSEGAPSLVLLMGESMGGAIVVLIAENEPDRYHGAVAIGAALQVRDAIYPLALTREPKIPVIFLTNRSEIEGPARYVVEAADAPVPPALWRIDRDGHVNVNLEERSLAIEGLITWITTNQIERQRDATVHPEASNGNVTFAEGAAHGFVGSVTEAHGNIFTTFSAADLARLGIVRGDDFELLAGGGTFRVRFGTNFSDVPRGEWIAFERAEGVMLIARNFANAGSTAGVSAGDPLTIRPLEKR